MIVMFGDGGHAKVIRELIKALPVTPSSITFVAIGDNRARKRVTEEVIEKGHKLSTLIHHNTLVSPSAKVGVGTVIMAGVIVQANAVIGNHCILNTNCTVDHDCVLEDYAHIAPGAHLCGNVHVGEGTLVGVGVGIAPNTEIPAWSIVKARRLEICPMK